MRECLLGGVRDAQRDVFHAEVVGNFPGRAFQSDCWAPAPLAHNFHVNPAHTAAPACSQSFHRSFLRRETAGIALELILELLAIRDFLRRVNAAKESLRLRLNHRPDALYFGDINTYADNHGSSNCIVQCWFFDGSPLRLYCPIVKASKTTQKRIRPRSARRAAPASPIVVPWRLHKEGDLEVVQLDPFRRLPWLVHGFSTRSGGVSELPGERILNLSFTEWDTRENVEENRRRLQRAIGADKFTLVAMKQIHSDAIHVFRAASRHVCSGDASVTSQPRLLLAAQTADCVPILLVDPKHRAVAAIHAGWRGTLARITEKTVGRMQLEFSSSPQDLLAAIGPSIGPCCYEVGADFVPKFTAQFADAGEYFDEPRSGEEPNPLQWLNMAPPGHQPPPKPVHLDLRKANRSQLLAAGLRTQSIFESNLCTGCRTDLFFSYRKEGVRSGRLLSVIGVRV